MNFYFLIATGFLGLAQPSNAQRATTKNDGGLRGLSGEEKVEAADPEAPTSMSMSMPEAEGILGWGHWGKYTKSPTPYPTSSPTMRPTGSPTKSPVTPRPTICQGQIISPSPDCPNACFQVLTTDMCPEKPLAYLSSVNDGCDTKVPLYGLCKSGGECGTNDNINQCSLGHKHGLDWLGDGYSLEFSVYQRVECGCVPSMVEFTEAPSISAVPSTAPSISLQPSESLAPSNVPSESLQPSVSLGPTENMGHGGPQPTSSPLAEGSCTIDYEGDGSSPTFGMSIGCPSPTPNQPLYCYQGSGPNRSLQCTPNANACQEGLGDYASCANAGLNCEADEVCCKWREGNASKFGCYDLNGGQINFLADPECNGPPPE